LGPKRSLGPALAEASKEQGLRHGQWSCSWRRAKLLMRSPGTARLERYLRGGGDPAGAGRRRERADLAPPRLQASTPMALVADPNPLKVQERFPAAIARRGQIFWLARPLVLLRCPMAGRPTLAPPAARFPASLGQRARRPTRLIRAARLMPARSRFASRGEAGRQAQVTLVALALVVVPGPRIPALAPAALRHPACARSWSCLLEREPVAGRPGGVADWGAPGPARWRVQGRRATLAAGLRWAARFGLPPLVALLAVGQRSGWRWPSGCSFPSATKHRWPSGCCWWSAWSQASLRGFHRRPGRHRAGRRLLEGGGAPQRRWFPWPWPPAAAPADPAALGGCAGAILRGT